MAATWIFSALIRNVDNGNYRSLQIEEIRKAKASTDIVAWLGLATGLVDFISHFVIFLLGERNSERRERDRLDRDREIEALLEKIREFEEELLPLLRGLNFITADKRAKLDSMRINGHELSGRTLDREVLRKLNLDKQDDFERLE